MQSGYLTLGLLGLIMALVLVLPFSVKKIEEELEAFLFLMGVSAVSISNCWSWHIIKEAVREPLGISITVLLVGLLFKRFRRNVETVTQKAIKAIGLSWTVFLVVAVLGLMSSVVTAIIAALILAEVSSILKLDRAYEIKFVVYACFAIGLGAVLTPLGEPLSTIVVAKLKGAPHYADFFFLFKLLGIWVVPGVLVMAFLAAFQKGHKVRAGETLRTAENETNSGVALRAGKVYIFVMALVFLGAGLKPLTEAVITKIADWQLFWINIISAALDNATLAAAEITPSMSGHKLTFILMGLLVAGGILIPGNIPNIICAGKLDIKSREWARVGVPAGLVLMGVYFTVLMLLAK